MGRILKGKGLIIKKTLFPGNLARVSIFTKEHGKVTAFAFGTKKLTSKRVSHLEVGNVITYSYRIKGDSKTLAETELEYAHSNIKSSRTRLSQMFDAFFVLNSLLPEEEADVTAYNMTLDFLKKLHNSRADPKDLQDFFIRLLLHMGYIDEKTAQSHHFDPAAFIEKLTDKKMKSF
ncbi:MAG: DNA repair protein RecO [Candidatus Paceibacterota bacterium]